MGFFLVEVERRGGKGFALLSPLSPPHSEPLFLTLRWKRTLSWRTWKDSRLLGERWCTGRLSTLVRGRERGLRLPQRATSWLSRPPPFFFPCQGHRLSVSISSTVWKTLVNSFLGLILLLSLCSVDFSGAHPWAMTNHPSGLWA
jgi:hypothetical protein